MSNDFILPPASGAIIPDQTTPCLDGTIIQASLPTYDGCEVLGKLRCFLIEQGQYAVLEWQLRNSIGKPVNISHCTPTAGESEQDVIDDLRTGVYVRIAEALNPSPSSLRYETQAEIADPQNGIVRVILTSDVTSEAGIYWINFGLYDGNGNLVLVNQPMLSVEKSLFAPDRIQERTGPPTLQEIRLHIRDSATENLMLAATEFDTAEIIRCIVAPIEEFNDMLPRLPFRYTTNTFPYKSLWMKAIHGHLLMLAAHHYRRERRRFEAEGLTWNEGDKAPEYEAAARELFAQWREGAQLQRQNSASRFMFGMVTSPYGW